jgi:hypothetical protein
METFIQALNMEPPSRVREEEQLYQASGSKGSSLHEGKESPDLSFAAGCAAEPWPCHSITLSQFLI